MYEKWNCMFGRVTDIITYGIFYYSWNWKLGVIKGKSSFWEKSVFQALKINLNWAETWFVMSQYDDNIIFCPKPI